MTKKPTLDLNDVRNTMEDTFRKLADITGNADADLSQECNKSRIAVVPAGEATNEEVIVAYCAISAGAGVEVQQEHFASGGLLSGHAEPPVLGALVLSICDRLIRAAVEAGAFPDAKVPLVMLAENLVPDAVHMESERCGHA